jgi:hypothetical protein
MPEWIRQTVTSHEPVSEIDLIATPMAVRHKPCRTQVAASRAGIQIDMQVENGSLVGSLNKKQEDLGYPP